MKQARTAGTARSLSAMPSRECRGCEVPSLQSRIRHPTYSIAVATFRGRERAWCRRKTRPAEPHAREPRQPGRRCGDRACTQRTGGQPRLSGSRASSETCEVRKRRKSVRPPKASLKRQRTSFGPCPGLTSRGPPSLDPRPGGAHNPALVQKWRCQSRTRGPTFPGVSRPQHGLRVRGPRKKLGENGDEGQHDA